MSSKQTTTEVTNTTDSSYTGRVKWFNNKAGYGFITVVIGDRQGEDIFVHHSGVQVSSEQYKYLVQGEYVEFTLKTSENTEHPYQAFDVTGVGSGKLMCETRTEQREQRESQVTENAADSAENKREPRKGGQRRGGNRNRRSAKPKGDGDGWDLEKKNQSTQSA